MAKTTQQPAAAKAGDKTDEAHAPSITEAKASAGEYAGSDEAGSLADVEDAQNAAPTDEPSAAFSSGFDADSVAKEQRAIKRRAEEEAKLNAHREEAAKATDDSFARMQKIEQRQAKLTAAVLALSAGEDIDVAALESDD